MPTLRFEDYSDDTFGEYAHPKDNYCLATVQAERVAKHKARLDTIAEWVRAGEAPGVAADAIRQCITWLQEAPTDDLEEFQHEAEQAIDRALSILPALESAAKDRAARAQAERRDSLAQQLADALTGKTKAQVVGALLTGDFHPAVIIDWSKV